MIEANISQMNNLRKCTDSPSNQGGSQDELWIRICNEVEAMATEEPMLRRYFHHTILQYDNMICALIHHLSNKLANDSISNNEWFEMLQSVMCKPCGRKVSRIVREDLAAVVSRDPACEGPAHAMLNFKGYLGLEASRIAHELWLQGRKSLALAMQCRISEIFGMDIHPACQIGSRVMIDHATGIVFGETAVIGDDCTFLHGVTLGGTGKERGDRHPKLGSGILVGAGAMVLGNITIGDGCKIAAGSVVLKPLPPQCTAAGVPARIVGQATEPKPGTEIDNCLWKVKFFSNEKCKRFHANGTEVHKISLEQEDIRSIPSSSTSE